MRSEVTYKALSTIPWQKVGILLVDLTDCFPGESSERMDKDFFKRINMTEVYGALKSLYDDESRWEQFSKRLATYHWGREFSE